MGRMKIEILQNGQVIETKELGEGSWKIGRAEECDIRLKSLQASKQHALLVIKGNKAAIVDMGSSNGVFVNGILVRKQRIEIGDEVNVADFKIRLAKPGRPGGTGGFRVPRQEAAFDGNAALAFDPMASAAP